MRHGSLAVISALIMLLSILVPAAPPALAGEGGEGSPPPAPTFVDSLDGAANTGAVTSPHFGQTLSSAVYGVSWVDGKEGSAAHLDGDTSYIGYNGSLLNPTEGTIRFWWKPDANLYESYQTPHEGWTGYGSFPTPLGGFLLDTVGWAGAFSGASGLWLGFSPEPGVLATSLSFGTWSDSGWSNATWSTPEGCRWLSDHWYDIAVTWSGTTGKIAVAVDGQKVAESSYNASLNSSEPFFLGQAPWEFWGESYWPYGPHTMTGAYDELQIYNVALDFPTPLPPPEVWVQSDATQTGPDAWSVTPGETFNLDFMVGSVPALYGASLDFKFDPAVVEVVYVNQGSLFSGLDPAGYAIPVSPWLGDGSLDPDINTQGLLSYAVTLLGQETSGIPAAPDGESLVEVTFRVKDNVDLSQGPQLPIRFTSSGGPGDLTLDGATALVKLATLVDDDNNPETVMVEAFVAYLGRDALVQVVETPPPVAIATDWLPEAAVSSPYSQLLYATGGEPPYTWSLVSGFLPDGLEMDTVGRIHGTPVAAGTFGFTVQVTDNAGSTATRDLELVVYSTPPPPGFWVEPGTVPETDQDIPITIHGQGFGTDVGQVTVKVRENQYYLPPDALLVKEAQVIAVQDDQISAVIPGGLKAGYYTIEVSVAGQLLATVFFEVTHVGTYVEPGYPGPWNPLVLPAEYDPAGISGWAYIGNLEVSQPDLAVRLVPVGPGQEVTLDPSLLAYTSHGPTFGEVSYGLPAGLASGKYEIVLDVTQNEETRSFKLALLVIGDPHIYWLGPHMFPAGTSELAVWMDAANISLDPAQVRVLVREATPDGLGAVVAESTEVWVGTWEDGSSSDGWVQAVLNAGPGLAGGRPYEVVLEVNGVLSLPWPVQATSGAILDYPDQYWYEAGVTDFVVELPGYNLSSDADYTVKLVTPPWSQNPGQVVARSTSVEIVNPMAAQAAGSTSYEPPYRLEKISGRAASYAAQGTGEAQGSTYRVQSGSSWPAQNILRASMHAEAPIPPGEYNLVVESPVQEIHYPDPYMPGLWVQFTDQPAFYTMQPWDLLPGMSGQVVQFYGINLEGKSFNVNLVNEADPATPVQAWDNVAPVVTDTVEQYLELTLPELAPGEYRFDISWDSGSISWWFYVGQPPEEQPLAIATDSLPEAAVGSSYSQLLDATGGEPPYTWSLVSGSLPDGLELDTVAGCIYGTPATVGNFNFEVSVTDAVYEMVTKGFNLTVGTGEAAGRGTVTGQVILQGRDPGKYGGVEVSVDTPSGRLATLTDANGNFVLSDVPEGTRELKFFKEKYLIRRVVVQVAAGDNTIEPVTLLVGDINGDNWVNLQDLTLLASAYRTETGQEGFDPRADLNADGKVNLQDLTLLATNYRKEGD